MTLISRKIKDAIDIISDDVAKRERERIKSIICNKGFLVNHKEHGHGYLIPDNLWIEIFVR